MDELEVLRKQVGLLQTRRDELLEVNGQLKSRIQGLKVNRDSLLEENRRFRAVINTKGKEIAELEQRVKELKSELEGRTDQASEAIYQLQLKISTAKEAKKGLRVELVQMGTQYFWLLMHGGRQLARSCKIEGKSVIEKEADAVAAQLELPVIVNERK